MAKHPSKQDLESLKRRIAKLRADGMMIEALRLTRTLACEHPSPGHADLLRDILMQRASYLLDRGQYAEAAAICAEAALQADAPSDYYAKVAERLAACGDISRALELLPRVADADQLRSRLFGHLADFAIQHGAAGKAKLPDDLHTSFDAILHAFRSAEADRDDDARAALQPIGLQSPFLDWKMLLRGLLAYYARDDAKAAENWKRLDPARLPYRLAIPIWQEIDPAFRASLPAMTQNSLHAKAEQLVGGKAQRLLQEVRDAISKPSLAGAFVAVDKLVATLKQEAPHLIPRVADCFRWLIIDHGHPDDLNRFVHVFGMPADDPGLHSLQALALESRGLMHDANAAWQAFLDDMTKHQARMFPADQLIRAQALVWRRMGGNASPASQDARTKGTVFDRLLDSREPSFKPSAAECYTKCIKLAPDLIDVRFGLFNLYRSLENHAKAKKVALELLKKFPEHAPTLEALGDLYRDENDPARAVEMYTRAQKANPLQRKLRSKLARERQRFARQLTQLDKFDEARNQLDLALANCDGIRSPLLCQGVVIELKACSSSAEPGLFTENQEGPAKPLNRQQDFLQQIRAEPNQRLASPYTILAEAVRSRIPKLAEKQLADALKSAIAQPVTPVEILGLIEAAALQRENHAASFKGQQALERSFGKLLESIDTAAINESQIERLCRHLGPLNLRTLWKKTLDVARKRFPVNPNIALSLIDYQLAAPKKSRALSISKDLLEKVRKLVNGMPRGELQGQLLDEIELREEKIRERQAARAPIDFELFTRFFGSIGDADEDNP